MRVIVTGNIGSGKSTVCELLASRLDGYARFSVDDAVRGLYDEPAFQEKLTALFGTCDRKAVSDRVFREPALRLALEEASLSFMRPRVAQAMELPRVVIEFPLLLELPGWAHRADFVVAVGCDEATQRERVLKRDGIPVEKFERIRASQHSSELKACIADVYLDTGCSLDALGTKVDEAAAQIAEQELQARCIRFFGTSAVWPVISKAYGEPHRAYHGLSHLRALFAGFDAAASATGHEAAIEMAIWFHDLVYETHSDRYANNEVASTRAMYRVLKELAPRWLEGAQGQQTFLAGEFILATRKHHLEAPFVLAHEARRLAGHLFLDLDLSILGAQGPALEAYDQAIAQEWGQSPGGESPAFCQGRSQALKAFMERPVLFFSPWFSEKEAVARSNLAELHRRWAAKAAPSGTSCL